MYVAYLHFKIPRCSYQHSFRSISIVYHYLGFNNAYIISSCVIYGYTHKCIFYVYSAGHRPLDDFDGYTHVIPFKIIEHLGSDCKIH